MGGYQKRIYFISCLSCKMKSFFKNFIKNVIILGLEHVLWLRGKILVPQVKNCRLRVQLQPLSAGQGLAGAFRSATAAQPVGCTSTHPWNYTSRENKNLEIHTHERPCMSNLAFPFKEEIENISHTPPPFF